MLKKISKKIIATSMSLAIASLLVVPTLVGAGIDDPSSEAQNYGLGTSAGFQGIGINKDTNLKSTIVNVINIVLGFLGIIAVVIILAGGFKWMTAGGSDDKIGEARKMIVQGLIGMVIVFLAWGIASFVLSQVKSATSAS